MNRPSTWRRAIPCAFASLAVGLPSGCGGGPVPASSVPRPELEQAIDKNSPEFKKIQADKSVPR